MKPHEISEIVLLGVRAYIAQENWSEALAFITKNYAKVVDTVAKADMLGKIHHALGNEPEAVRFYEELL